MTTGLLPSPIACSPSAYLMWWKCVSAWVKSHAEAWISDAVKRFHTLSQRPNKGFNMQVVHYFMLFLQLAALFSNQWSVSSAFFLKAEDVQQSQRERQCMTGFHVNLNKAPIVPSALWVWSLEMRLLPISVCSWQRHCPWRSLKLLQLFQTKLLNWTLMRDGSSFHWHYAVFYRSDDPCEKQPQQ